MSCDTPALAVNVCASYPMSRSSDNKSVQIDWALLPCVPLVGLPQMAQSVQLGLFHASLRPTKGATILAPIADEKPTTSIVDEDLANISRGLHLVEEGGIPCERVPPPRPTLRIAELGCERLLRQCRNRTALILFLRGLREVDHCVPHLGDMVLVVRLELATDKKGKGWGLDSSAIR